MTAIKSEVQKLHTDAIVTLYTVDTTVIGGASIFRFTSMLKGENETVIFDGEAYTPHDITVSGFLWDGRGAFPTPTMRLANTGGLVSAAIIAHKDLIGSTFIRTRTFAQFLDTGSNPDPTAYFPQEIYTIEQKSDQNKVFVEFKLSSILDQTGRKLPARQALKSRCTHRYRLYDPVTGDFDYTGATCPYTAAPTYDATGTLTTPDLDNCGRRLADCKLRFGATNPLYTRAFPGVATRLG